MRYAAFRQEELFLAIDDASGTLGSAILFGLLASSAEEASRNQLNGSNGTRHEEDIPNRHNHHASDEDEGLQKPSRILACVKTEESEERLRKQLAVLEHSLPVVIVRGDNARAVQAADTVLLGCKPQDMTSCLGAPAVQKALQGKLLISILAGVTIPQIEEVLTLTEPKANMKANGVHPAKDNRRTTAIVRAMPNTASFVRSSTTVITSCAIASPSDVSFVEWLFASIGTVTRIPAAQFDACTALCGSTPAFFAHFIESLLDGAVALGLKRSEAMVMAANTMKGTAMLILAGEQPETLKEKVATPGGSTIQGLLELERKALRGIVADALIKCTAAASVLGSTQA
ncbi:MAG: hypothetical protein L6R40_003133 [Gallowayella cf. fulva]|nr:MAG: hypothetical protein L6R40_003133 [Xanthomendoza cf. fulva]